MLPQDDTWSDILTSDIPCDIRLMTAESLLICYLGALKTKSGGGSKDVLGGDFVLKGPNPFLKRDRFVTGRERDGGGKGGGGG